MFEYRLRALPWTFGAVVGCFIPYGLFRYGFGVRILLFVAAMSCISIFVAWTLRRIKNVAPSWSYRQMVYGLALGVIASVAVLYFRSAGKDA